MSWKDDDEEDVISSHPESLARADKGKQEARERKAREKGDLLKLQRQVLKGQVDEKKNVTAKDDQPEEDTQSPDKKSQTFHTETLKEKEEKQKGRKDKHEDAGTIVEKNKQQPEMSEEEIQSEPG